MQEAAHLLVIPKRRGKKGQQARHGLTSSTAHFPVTCLFQQLHSLKFPSLSIMLWNYESISVWLSSWSHRPHDELLFKNPTCKYYLYWGPSPLHTSLQGDMSSSNCNRCCLLFVPPLVRTPVEPRMLQPLLGAQTKCSTNSLPAEMENDLNFPQERGY